MTGCNLRCVWCDSEFAWEEGEDRELSSLLDQAAGWQTEIVVVTGGEPLRQSPAADLITGLADIGKTVLVETNGTLPIEHLDPRAMRIVDVKPPSAHAEIPFFLENLIFLRPTDELKFLVANRADFDFAVEFIRMHQLATRCSLLFLPVFGRLDPAELADWILGSHLPLRLQLQLHKVLWNPQDRGR